MYIQVQFGYVQLEYVYMGSMYTEWRGVREREDGEEGTWLMYKYMSHVHMYS